MSLNSPKSDPPSFKEEIILAEYKSVRDETLKRIELRLQTRYYTLLAFGALLTAAVSQAVAYEALLAYPVLAMVLALSDAYNFVLVHTLGTYVRVEIENKAFTKAFTGDSYQHWADYLKERHSEVENLDNLGAWVLFLGTELAAIIFAYHLITSGKDSESSRLASDTLLFVVSGVAFALTIWFLYKTSMLAAKAKGGVSKTESVGGMIRDWVKYSSSRNLPIAKGGVSRLKSVASSVRDWVRHR